MRFLIRRTLHSLLLLISVSLLSFALTSVAPGDFFESMRLNPDISASTVAALRRKHGLDERLPVRYLRWVQSGLRGEWGYSFAYQSPAGALVRSRAANTLLLTGTATLLAWIIALPLGICAATRPGATADCFASGTIALLLATPEVVLGLLLLLFAVRTRYFPVGGLIFPAPSGSKSSDAWTTGMDVAHHLLLPSVCLAAGLLPLLLSHVRSAIRDTMQAPFVTAARSYGIPFRWIVLRHALPVAANPLISLLGLSIGMLVSSSLLVEVIFSWPGLGQLMVEAILQRDFFLVIDSAMLTAAFLVMGNFLADLLLYVSDPRIRAT